MCSRRILLSQSRAGTAFGVVFLFLVILFGTTVGGCGADEGGRWILVYKVDEKKTVWRPDKMDSLVTAIRRRVNPDGRKDISVKSLGDNMVEIILPSVSGRTAKERQAEADETRKFIRATGALEFRLVATTRDNESLIEMAKTERKRFPVIPSKTVVISGLKSGKELAKWCRVRDQEVDKIKGNDAAMMVGKVPVKDGKEVQKEVWEVLVLTPESEAYNVTGGHVRDARASMDQGTATPIILFSFNSEGGQRFGRLTGEHVPVGSFLYRLAIVLDDELQTAPVIRSAIFDSGQITGNFTQKEVDEIVRIINAGSLPVALVPTPVRDTSVEDTARRDSVPSAGTPSK